MTRARDLSNLIGSGNYTSTTFTATAGQTVFTIAHTQGFIQVFMNGLLLDETTDYTSDGTAVTLTEAATAGDELEVVKYNTFSVGDAITQTDADTRYVNASGDTMTGTLNATGIARNTNGLRIGASNASTGYGLRIGASGATDPLEIWRDHANGDQMQLSVDYYGRVTMPNQPMFSAYNLATAAQYAVTGNTWTTFDSNLTNWNTTHWYADTNIGSGFSASNGRFTAPVAGKYRLNLHVSYYVQNTAYIVIFKNGTYQAPYALAYTTPSASYQSLSVSSILQLSVGDYVEAGGYMRTSETYIPGGGYINFSGQLLG